MACIVAVFCVRGDTIYAMYVMCCRMERLIPLAPQVNLHVTSTDRASTCHLLMSQPLSINGEGLAVSRGSMRLSCLKLPLFCSDLPLSPTVHGRLVGTLPSAVTCVPQHKVWTLHTHTHTCTRTRTRTHTHTHTHTHAHAHTHTHTHWLSLSLSLSLSLLLPQLVSWQANPLSPYQFAVGQSSGKVLLVH